MNPIERNHVTESGKPSGRPIVFIHGIGTDQRAWAGVAEALSGEYRLVLLDNVGAGRADPGAFVNHRYLNLEAYAEDTIEVLASLDLREAIVVGHSIGAMIGALAARKAANRVAALVLVAASPRYLSEDGYPGGLQPEDVDGIYRAATSDFQDWAAQFTETATGHPADSAPGRRFLAALNAVPQDRLLTVLCSTLQTDHRREVARIAVPTLILQSREDPFVPLAVAEYLRDHIPESRLEVLESRGHLPHVDNAPGVAQAIRRFEQGLSPRR